MQLFSKLQHTDSLINLIQDRLKSVINAIAGKEVVDGQIVTVDSIGGTMVRVQHKLGRVPNGWILVNGHTSADTIVELLPPDSNFIYLSTSGFTTMTNRKFWVF